MGHDFNSFFPWTINQDGTGEETLAHIGRHELSYFIPPVFNDDPSLEPMDGLDGQRFNPNPVENVQIRESAISAGTYIGVDCLYDGTHASGRIFSVTAPPDHPADQIAVSFLTHPHTFFDTSEAPDYADGHTGFYRNPLPLSDGTLIAVHTPHTIRDANLGTPEQPVPRYDLRIKSLVPDGPYLQAGAPLTPGIVKYVLLVFAIGDPAPGQAPADALLESSFVLRPDHHHHPREAGAQSVVDRILEQGLATRADRRELFEPAVAGSRPGGQNDEGARHDLSASAESAGRCRRTPEVRS